MQAAKGVPFSRRVLLPLLKWGLLRHATLINYADFRECKRTGGCIWLGEIEKMQYLNIKQHRVQFSSSSAPVERMYGEGLSLAILPAVFSIVIHRE
jgi:hypothetical protein